MDLNDLRIIADAFLTICFVKVIVEPLAVRAGRFFLRKADEQVDIIPDFLYESHHCHEDED